MDINLTTKNVGYDSQGDGYHFSARFNSNAQILSFGVDIMNASRFDEIMELFDEEFKPAIYNLIEEDIVIPEVPEEEPAEEEQEEEIPNEENPEEGENE